MYNNQDQQGPPAGGNGQNNPTSKRSLAPIGSERALRRLRSSRNDSGSTDNSSVISNPDEEDQFQANPLNSDRGLALALSVYNTQSRSVDNDGSDYNLTPMYERHFKHRQQAAEAANETFEPPSAGSVLLEGFNLNEKRGKFIDAMGQFSPWLGYSEDQFDKEDCKLAALRYTFNKSCQVPGEEKELNGDSETIERTRIQKVFESMFARSEQWLKGCCKNAASKTTQTDVAGANPAERQARLIAEVMASFEPNTAKMQADYLHALQLAMGISLVKPGAGMSDNELQLRRKHTRQLVQHIEKLLPTPASRLQFQDQLFKYQSQLEQQLQLLLENKLKELQLQAPTTSAAAAAKEAATTATTAGTAVASHVQFHDQLVKSQSQMEQKMEDELNESQLQEAPTTSAAAVAKEEAAAEVTTAAPTATKIAPTTETAKDFKPLTLQQFFDYVQTAYLVSETQKQTQQVQLQQQQQQQQQLTMQLNAQQAQFPNSQSQSPPTHVPVLQQQLLQPTEAPQEPSVQQLQSQHQLENELQQQQQEAIKFYAQQQQYPLRPSPRLFMTSTAESAAVASVDQLPAAMQYLQLQPAESNSTGSDLQPSSVGSKHSPTMKEYPTAVLPAPTAITTVETLAAAEQSLNVDSATLYPPLPRLATARSKSISIKKEEPTSPKKKPQSNQGKGGKQQQANKNSTRRPRARPMPLVEFGRLTQSGKGYASARHAANANSTAAGRQQVPAAVPSQPRTNASEEFEGYASYTNVAAQAVAKEKKSNKGGKNGK